MLLTFRLFLFSFLFILQLTLFDSEPVSHSGQKQPLEVFCKKGDFYGISKKTCFTEHLRTTASVRPLTLLNGGMYPKLGTGRYSDQRLFENCQFNKEIFSWSWDFGKVYSILYEKCIGIIYKIEKKATKGWFI